MKSDHIPTFLRDVISSIATVLSLDNNDAITYSCITTKSFNRYFASIEAILISSHLSL